MANSNGNLFKRLLELLPAQPVLVGTISALYNDGTALVLLPGGGALRPRNPLSSVVGSLVFVQGDIIQGPAPALPFYELEV